VQTNNSYGGELGKSMHYAYLATELPIMVGLCAYLGYIVGNKISSYYGLIGIVAGGLIGFIIGILGLFFATGVLHSSLTDKGAKKAKKIGEQKSASLDKLKELSDTVEQLKKLSELRDTGGITDEEFQAKKKELIAKM